MMRSILCILLLLISAEFVHAQVTISPTAVFISRDRFGSFVVINNSSIAQEVSIDFIQTIPTSDSLGNVSVIDASDKADEFKMMTDWIRSFPRTFVLQPTQRQTVRLTVRPGNAIDDGTYWTRVRVTANPQAAEIGAVETERVATNITIKFEQVISGFYKVGNVNSGVQVSGVRSVQTEASRLLVYDYSLTGNSPFIGTIDMDVLDANGRSVHKGRLVTSLYDNGSRNFPISPTEVPPGVYSVVLSFSSTRPDIPSADAIPMETVTQRFNVTVP